MSEDAANLTERAEKALRARAEGRTTPCSCEELLEHLFEFLDSELDEEQLRIRRSMLETDPPAHRALRIAPTQALREE